MALTAGYICIHQHCYLFIENVQPPFCGGGDDESFYEDSSSQAHVRKFGTLSHHVIHVCM